MDPTDSSSERDWQKRAQLQRNGVKAGALNEHPKKTFKQTNSDARLLFETKKHAAEEGAELMRTKGQRAVEVAIERGVETCDRDVLRSAAAWAISPDPGPRDPAWTKRASARTKLIRVCLLRGGRPAEALKEALGAAVGSAVDWSTCLRAEGEAGESPEGLFSGAFVRRCGDWHRMLRGWDSRDFVSVFKRVSARFAAAFGRGDGAFYGVATADVVSALARIVCEHRRLIGGADEWMLCSTRRRILELVVSSRGRDAFAAVEGEYGLQKLLSRGAVLSFVSRRGCLAEHVAPR